MDEMEVKIRNTAANIEIENSKKEGFTANLTVSTMINIIAIGQWFEFSPKSFGDNFTAKLLMLGSLVILILSALWYLSRKVPVVVFVWIAVAWGLGSFVLGEMLFNIRWVSWLLAVIFSISAFINAIGDVGFFTGRKKWH